MINIFEPTLGKSELAVVEAVFNSKWIGKGKYVKDFEREFALNLNSDPEHFVSTNSCTEAIFQSAELFNFNRDDEVLVPSINFIAIGNAIVARNAKLRFCDVDLHSLNVTAELIEKHITRQTKAIYLNHYGGVSCDMDPIIELCRKSNIIIIEDAACAPYSFYKGRACGTMGDMGMWSFDAMKILSTMDGGMIYLQSDTNVDIVEESLYFGLSRKQKSGIDSAVSGIANWWEIQINRPGRRSIMNNVSAAIGLSQLKKLRGFIQRRKEIYDYYKEELSKLDWITTPPVIPNDYKSSYYFFWIQLQQRDKLALFLKENDVYTTFRYWPLHMVKYFNSKQRLFNAERIAETTLNLPLHQNLTDKDVNKVVDLIKTFGKKQL